MQDFKNYFEVDKDSGYQWIKEASEHSIKEYLQKKFNKNYTNTMIVIFASILDPQGKQFRQRDTGTHIRELIFKLLYRFNRLVMEELLGYEEFIELIRDPLDLPNLIEMLMGNRDNEEIRQQFMKQVEMLKNVCISEAATIPKILLTYLS